MRVACLLLVAVSHLETQQAPQNSTLTYFQLSVKYMLTDLHNKPVKPKPIPLPYPLRSHPTQGPSYSKAISSKRTGGRRVPLRGWANGVIGSIPTSCDLGESTKSMGGRKKGMLGLESFHPAKSGWHSLYILELEFLFHNSKTHLIQKSHGKKISQKYLRSPKCQETQVLLNPGIEKAPESHLLAGHPETSDWSGLKSGKNMDQQLFDMDTPW